MAKMAKWEFMKELYRLIWTDAGLSRAIPGSLFWSVSSGRGNHFYGDSTSSNRVPTQAEISRLLCVRPVMTAITRTANASNVKSSSNAQKYLGHLSFW